MFKGIYPMKTMLKTAFLVLSTSVAVMAMDPTANIHNDDTLGLEPIRQLLFQAQNPVGNPVVNIKDLVEQRDILAQKQNQYQQLTNDCYPLINHAQEFNLPPLNPAITPQSLLETYTSAHQKIQGLLNELNAYLATQGIHYMPPVMNHAPVYPAPMMAGMPAYPGYNNIMPARQPSMFDVNMIDDPMARTSAQLAMVANNLQNGTYIEWKENGRKISIHKKTH